MFPDESEKLAIKSVSSETDIPLATLYDNYYRLNDFDLFAVADEKGFSVNVTIATSLVSHVVLHASKVEWVPAMDDEWKFAPTVPIKSTPLK